MKKVLTLTLFAATLFVACENEVAQTASQEQSRNRVIVLPSENKTGNSVLLLMEIGHDGKDCQGCVWDGGRYIHENCMGYGTYCPATAAVQLQQIGTAVTATTTDTFGLTSLNKALIRGIAFSWISRAPATSPSRTSCPPLPSPG